MSHLEIVSNGMGSASMYMLVMAARGEIPARLSITGDTGSENDCLWSTGERTTARDYFDRVIEPYARDRGMEAVHVKALNKAGEPHPGLLAQLRAGSTAGVPFFGSDGGRLSQACTQRTKIAAIRQEARRRGATTMRVALGLTMDEVHRMKPSDVQWATNYWPLIDARLYRSMIQDRLTSEGIPWLITTECDMCPHKDFPRWQRTAPEVIQEIAVIEEQLEGLYFTDRRVPLLQALEQMENEEPANTLFDGCDAGYCFT